MKKIVTACALALCAVAAKADEVKFITFKTLHGTETSLPIAGGVRISFSQQTFTAQGTAQSFAAPLNEMSAFWLSPSPTAIASTMEKENEVSRVDVFALDGKRVASYATQIEATSQLPKGVYLIRNGSQTFKKLVK